ncbi:glycosyltransferase [Clostridium baratii]|nr:glycosyltransferase [Clostridium baratii]AQM58649.1 glycosyl transferase [Clostridium baratii]KJU72351.1 glycosyl transferase [Clostridium baratii]
MKKKVCQMVWNHFTNDARVLRECTSLVEAGYDVTLVAIDDPNDEKVKRREIKDGINIVRVKRYPSHYIFTRKVLRRVKEFKILLLPLIIIYLALLYFSKILGILALLYMAFMMNGTLRGIMLKCHIALHMTYHGFKANGDIYHSNDLNTLPQGYICSKLRRTPIIYDSHEVQSSRTGYNEKTVKFFEGFFVKRVNKMIMTTDTRAEYVSNLYKIEKPAVIHNYPFYTGDKSIKNKIDLHNICDIDKDEPILLYQGGIQQGRGLEQIVKAIPKFKKGIVVFIGDGKIKNNLKKLVEDTGVSNRVRFIDKVPVDELKYYTASAYLGFQVLNNVCFNHYSALSNKLFEYIMSEVPVVACSFPEISRVVRDGEIGICVDSENPSSIARGVNTLLDDIGHYELFKKNCKKAKEIYNWDNEKRLFVNIYDEILKDKINNQIYTKELNEV